MQQYWLSHSQTINALYVVCEWLEAVNKMEVSSRFSELLDGIFFRRMSIFIVIRLFALDFYEVIVDSACGHINYHLIEISS